MLVFFPGGEDHVQASLPPRHQALDTTSGFAVALIVSRPRRRLRVVECYTEAQEMIAPASELGSDGKQYFVLTGPAKEKKSVSIPLTS